MTMFKGGPPAGIPVDMTSQVGHVTKYTIVQGLFAIGGKRPEVSTT
jgi:hypothetical protein